tara:strand:- start:391 stop:753 length:363 start_codon:yes stop_codon:yes gene_type:complete
MLILEKEKLSPYTVNSSITINEVLIVIDSNCRRGVIVVSGDNKVLGILTDGDIRKALIRGRFRQSQITDIVNLTYKFIEYQSPDLLSKKALQIFEKHKEIEIIPIVNKSNQLHAAAIRRE